MMNLPHVVPQEEQSLLSVEHGWHVDFINFLRAGLPKIGAAVLIAALAWWLVSFFVDRMRRRADSLVGNSRHAAQLRTVAGILRASASALIGFSLFLQLLSAIGVSLGPFIASAGVIGLGISFGAQSLFKDILNGILILVEDQYSVGDVVKVASLTGTVEDLTLRCTKLRDGDGTLHVVPNSGIATVSNMSRDYSVATLSLSVSPREDPARIVAILRQLAAEVQADEAFNDVILANPEVLGVDRVSSAEVVYPINVRVRANQRDGVLRALRQRILVTFTREGLEFGALTSAMVRTEPTPLSRTGSAPAEAASTLPSTR